ncbi:MAG: recombination mediator RecR [Chloroflexi bacterium]|nr:recombination mediator RecR [Chloroflexota bacterium]MCY3938164.1 recombination mediator RecR [Chloroflexota bacterium]
MVDGVPGPISRLVEELSKLPTIGPKTAGRLAFFLLKAPARQVDQLAEALRSLRSEIVECSVCFNFSDGDPCHFCTDPGREGSTVCVVEDPLDVLAVERSAGFRGRYHVLHGAISPLEGIGPDDLKIDELLERVKDGGVAEVIVATNATFEGDATALEIARVLEETGVRLTRLARGLATGGDIEYADPTTLSQALDGRREF